MSLPGMSLPIHCCLNFISYVLLYCAVLPVEFSLRLYTSSAVVRFSSTRVNLPISMSCLYWLLICLDVEM